MIDMGGCQNGPEWARSGRGAKRGQIGAESGIVGPRGFPGIFPKIRVGLYSGLSSESPESQEKGGQKRVPNWRIIKYHRKMGTFSRGTQESPILDPRSTPQISSESEVSQNGPINRPPVRHPQIYTPTIEHPWRSMEHRRYFMLLNLAK